MVYADARKSNFWTDRVPQLRYSTMTIGGAAFHGVSALVFPDGLAGEPLGRPPTSQPQASPPLKE